MKIAVTYENGQIFQHFGHTAQFKVYEAQDGKILSSQVVDTNGSGHGALAGFLAAQGCGYANLRRYRRRCTDGFGRSEYPSARRAYRAMQMKRLKRSCPVRLCITRMSSAAITSITGKDMTAPRRAATTAADIATAKPCPDRKNAAVCAVCRCVGSLVRAVWVVRASRSRWDWMNMRSSV